MSGHVTPLAGAPRLYDRVAPAYRLLHSHWLWIGGEKAVAALEGCCAAELRAGASVLDAGCGPGDVARRVKALEPRCRLTLMDAAPAMLARTADLEAERQIGDIRHLPFDDASFDLVTSSWVLETLDDPDRKAALNELARVLKPGGLLCYCVCSRPTSPLARLTSAATRAAIEAFFHGRFLGPDQILAPPGGSARRVSYHGGLSTLVTFRKSLDRPLFRP